MEELEQIRRFTVADPRTFDGDVYETAERAIRQAGAVAQVLDEALSTAYTMLRNAELDRQLILTGDCDAPGFDDTPQGRKFEGVRVKVQEIESELSTLTKVAAFNPRRRIPRSPT